MSSAICFNLDQSKMLLSGNELKTKDCLVKGFKLFTKQQNCRLVQFEGT